MKKTIRLEKDGEHGKCFWAVDINGSKIVESWGYVDGKHQSKETVFKEGKNVGRSNETTPEEQCAFEAEIKVRKKLDKEYKLVKGELSAEVKATVRTAFDVPLPMLAKTYENQQKKVVGTIYLQPKLDGNRCLVNRFTGKMYSRTRKEIAHLSFISEAVAQACQDLPKDVTWVDGELFAIGLTFNDMQTIIRREKNVDEVLAGKMRYHIFDVISPDSWSKRRDILLNIKGSKVVKVVEDVKVDASKLKEYHDKYVTEGGYEGAIIRLDGYGYECGPTRSSSLIKYKIFKDSEFKIVGWKSEKHDSKLLGAAILEMKDGQTFEARPAMTVEEKADLWQHKDEYIGKMATIKYQELDAKSGIPRFPVYKGVRAEGDIE